MGRRRPRGARVLQLLPAGFNQPRRHRVGVNRRGQAALGRRVTPFKFVIVGLGRKIRGVPQCDLLIQRIGRRQHFHFPRVELRRHAEELEAHRLAFGREGAAVAEHHRHPPAALAGAGHRIVCHRRLRAADRRRRGRIDRERQRRIDRVGPLLERIRPEGLHRRGERVDGARPEAEVGVADGHEIEEALAIGQGQDVEADIILAQDFREEFPREHQRARGAPHGIKINIRLQMRRQALEVLFAVALRRQERGRQRGEAAGRPEREGFFAKRIVQHHTGFGRRGRRRRRRGPPGQRLLVKHLGAGLPVNAGQPKLGPRERLPYPQLRRIGRPGRGVSDRERAAGDWIALRRRADQGAQIGQRRAGHGLGRQTGQIKSVPHRVPELHAKRGRLRRIMRAAVDPVIAFAIEEEEAGVGRFHVRRRTRHDLGRVAGQRHFGVLGQPGDRVQRQGQEGDRHRGRHQRAGENRVGEDGRAEFALHFEDVHGGAPVSRRGMINQDRRLRSISRRIGPEDVEIVAQSVGPAVEHQRMFLVRIEARQRAVVLDIELTGGFRRAQVPRARIRREDDFVGHRGVGRKIDAFFRRQEERLEISTGRRHRLEPPDGQGGRAGQRIDRDDGPAGGVGHADGERIQIGRRVEIGPRFDVTGGLIAERRHQALSDHGGTGEGGGPVALLEARAADRLGVEPDVPNLGAVGELQERAIQPIRPGKINEQALGIQVDLGFGLGRIILEHQRGQSARGKRHPRQRRAPRGRHQIVGVAGEAGGPRLRVGVFQLRPRNAGHHRPTRLRKSDAHRLARQPIKRDPVRAVVLALGVIIQPSVSPQNTAVIRHGFGRGRVHRRREPFLIQVQGLPDAGRILGHNFLAQQRHRIRRRHGADDINDVRAQEDATDRRTRLQAAQILDHDPAFQIVGPQLGDGRNLRKPERAQFGPRHRHGQADRPGDRNAAVIRALRDAGGHVFLGDLLWKVVTIHRVDTFDRAGQDADRGRREGLFRPIDFARRHRRGRGDREVLLTEQKPLHRGTVHRHGLRRRRHPGDARPARLMGEHAVRMGAVINRELGRRLHDGGRRGGRGRAPAGKSHRRRRGIARADVRDRERGDHPTRHRRGRGRPGAAAAGQGHGGRRRIAGPSGDNGKARQFALGGNQFLRRRRGRRRAARERHRRGGRVAKTGRREGQPRDHPPGHRGRGPRTRPAAAGERHRRRRRVPAPAGGYGQPHEPPRRAREGRAGLRKGLTAFDGFLAPVGRIGHGGAHLHGHRRRNHIAEHEAGDPHREAVPQLTPDQHQRDAGIAVNLRAVPDRERPRDGPGAGGGGKGLHPTELGRGRRGPARHRARGGEEQVEGPLL